MSDIQLTVYAVACASTSASLLLNNRLTAMQKFSPVCCIFCGFLIALLK